MTYVKAHIAAIGALLVAVLTTIQQTGHLDRAGIVAVAISILGLVLHYVVQNTAGGVRKYAQAVISSLVVAGQIAAPFIIAGHITYAQLLIVGVTLVQAVEVFWTGDKVAATVVNVQSGPVITRAPEQTADDEAADKARYSTPTT